MLNYQQRPYTAFVQGSTPGTVYIIDNQLTAELDAAIGLFGRYQVGIGLPFTGPGGEPIFGLTPEQRLAQVPPKKKRCP